MEASRRPAPSAVLADPGVKASAGCSDESICGVSTTVGATADVKGRARLFASDGQMVIAALALQHRSRRVDEAAIEPTLTMAPRFQHVTMNAALPERYRLIDVDIGTSSVTKLPAGACAMPALLTRMSTFAHSSATAGRGW